MSEQEPMMVDRAALERRVNALHQKRREWRLLDDEKAELRVLKGLSRLLVNPVEDGEG